MKLWDDGDKVLDILKRFGSDIYSSHYSFDHPMRYEKVYIDEIQDFTQIETLMFFLATGLDVTSLFMVGDTAQSVEEGRAFRFEEIRSIVHKISNGTQTITKPFKLQTNFRAHAGILEVAASILDRLFLAYPASSSAHTTDEGVFGPRPEFYPCSYTTDVDDADNDDVELVRKLISVNQRLMILTPESNIDRMNLLLNNPVQLLGVKESKGLEWTDCVILDFFCNIPKSDSKAWKQLLENDKVGRGDLWPQLETQLKQLYVAITRSCNRLIFIETKPSEIATRMFKYWTVRSPLVVRYKPDTETFDLLTADESVKRGLDFVLSATDLESDDNNDYNKMLK
jgi:superfamily I DNA/RNA helicase